jgi:hypothetical protein
VILEQSVILSMPLEFSGKVGIWRERQTNVRVIFSFAFQNTGIHSAIPKITALTLCGPAL